MGANCIMEEIMKKILLLIIVCLYIVVSGGCGSHPQTATESTKTYTEPWCICKSYDSDVDIWALVEGNKDVYSYTDLKTDGTLGEISAKLVLKKLPDNKYDHSEGLRILCFNNANDANNAYKKILVGDCSYAYYCDVSSFFGSMIKVGTQIVMSQYGVDGNGKVLRSLLTSAKLDFPNTIDDNVSKNKVSEYNGEIDLESTIENLTGKGYEVVRIKDIPSNRENVYLIFNNENLLVGRIDSCVLDVGNSIEELVTWLSEGYDNTFGFLFTQGGIIVTKYDDTLDDMIIGKC